MCSILGLLTGRSSVGVNKVSLLLLGPNFAVQGCHQLPDSESLASSSGGAHGLRLVQALVLAGADPRPLLQLSQQECADSDFRCALACAPQQVGYDWSKHLVVT